MSQANGAIWCWLGLLYYSTSVCSHKRLGICQVWRSQLTISAITISSGTGTSTERERARAGQPGPEHGGRRNSDAEGLLDALLFVLRKKKSIRTAGTNGGELDLADAQKDAGTEDANLGKERVPPRAVLDAREGQPLDFKKTSKTTERQSRKDGVVVMGRCNGPTHEP